jgi:hypothetical protein
VAGHRQIGNHRPPNEIDPAHIETIHTKVYAISSQGRVVSVPNMLAHPLAWLAAFVAVKRLVDPTGTSFDVLPQCSIAADDCPTRFSQWGFYVG